MSSSDRPSVPDRRRFLGRLALGAAGAAVLPTRLAAEEGKPPPLPEPPSGLLRNEAYWERVKARFTIREGLIPLNAANLCPAPLEVQEAVFRHDRSMDADPSFQNRETFGELRESARSGLARYLGAAAEEIALVRNTSEGNNTVVQGLELEPGDEVVLWDQNHPTNDTSWDVRAERLGFTVRRVGTPPAGENPTPEDLAGALLDALTPSTRLLSFSHVSNVSGVGLPARTICREARRRGVATLVDGAQTFGSMVVDLHDLGCDFYTGSAHKWFMGPREVGVLYVREARVADLWAPDVGVGWSSALEGGARKFETLGQRHDAALSAMNAAVGFHERIGPEAVQARVHELAAAMKEALRRHVPDVRFHTPDGPEMSAGVVVFDAPGIEPGPSFQRLYAQHGIAGAPRGAPFSGVRYCPHVYNTLADVERAAEAAGAVARS